MQANRTADDPALAGSVRGLGLSDALRLELQPAQVPWLIDELDQRRVQVEQALERAGAAWARSPDADTRRDREEREYELDLVRAMRASLPASDQAAPVAFIGPTRLVTELVRGAMRSVVESLGALTFEQLAGRPEQRRMLEETAAAAAGWVRTFLDCCAVTWFNFDPDADPAAPW